MTAFGAVVRADSVRRLSEAGWRQLVDYGIERIVDLRFRDELEADPPATIPVEVVHVPVLPDPASGDWPEIDAVGNAAPDDVSATRAVYLEFLHRYPKGFAQAVSAVASAPPGGVLVHCMAGKDRTGLVSALLLRIAGVSIDDVAADYAVSERNLLPLWQGWFDAAEDDVERRRRLRIAATPAAAMSGVLHDLAREGGEGGVPARGGRRRRGARRGSRAPPGVSVARLRLAPVGETMFPTSPSYNLRWGLPVPHAPSTAHVPTGWAMSVLAIFGPTASGKTAVAEALAERIPAEIVSADSMQVYRGLPVLTNQGRGESTARLVGIWSTDRQRTVGEYQALAHAAIDEALDAGRTPIVVGGSGLYFRAALVDLELPPDVPPGERARWERLYDRRGGETAHALLSERDPRAAAHVHPNDRKRVVRALELWAAGASLAPAASRLWTEETRRPTTIVGLDVPRDVLDERIVARTREMFEQGVEQEVREAGAVVPRILGFDAISRLPPEEAEPEVVRATKRLAAYQRKWLRRIPGALLLPGDRPVDAIADDVLELAMRARCRPERPSSPPRTRSG